MSSQFVVQLDNRPGALAALGTVHAMVVHGEEALLAVGFIFTIHFFNSNLRPEKFPVDVVMFTGRAREESFEDEETAATMPISYANPLQAG